MSNKNIGKFLGCLSKELAKHGIESYEQVRSVQWQNYLQDLSDKADFGGLATGAFEEFKRQGYVDRLADELRRGDSVQKALGIVKRGLGF